MLRLVQKDVDGGQKVYYADERKPDGSPGIEISGRAY